jgi:hypothetical protein
MREAMIKFCCLLCGASALFIAIHVPAMVWEQVSTTTSKYPTPWFVRYAPTQLLIDWIDAAAPEEKNRPEV